MADNERTSIDFGSGETIIVGLGLKLAASTLERYLKRDELWVVVGDWYSPHGPSKENGMQELIVNPKQVKTLRRV